MPQNPPQHSPQRPAEEPAGLGYVVDDGTGLPSLEDEIRAHGPLTGTALHRLAIATMTGLAALHRAGITHGAVRPDTVLLGPRGPRPRHPVPASAPPALDDETVAAGTLVWSTPEHVRGLPVSASGDLFTWAATMVYAATGRSPFGEGSMTTVVNRLLHGAADLGPLDGPLRALAADCLAAEAGERPTAEEALLRLIGYSGLLDTALLSEPVPPADPPARRRRPRTPVLLAAALAVALVSAGVTYLLVPPSPARPAAAPASTASPPAVTARPPATPPPATPPPATTETGLPTGGTLYENPADPVKLASYHVGQDGKRTVAYARAGTSGDFRRVGGANAVAVVSHDGRRLAVVNELSFAQFQRQEVAFTDHRTGERFALPAATAPDVAQFLNWNRDNRRALLTVIGSLGQGPPVTRGFVILDVVARTSTFVPTTDAQDRPDPDAVPPVYYWTPDGNGVMAYYTTPELRNGVLFRDLTGRVTRTMHWVGNPVGRERFSPSGRLFVTTGCGIYDLCVWDTATGERRATVPGDKGAYAIGWYDDRHLIRGRWAGKDTFRVSVTAFDGTEVRLLAEMNSTGEVLPHLTFVTG